MQDEQKRAVQEGLNEERHRGATSSHFASFDLLKKDNLAKTERERVKQASRSLLGFMSRGASPSSTVFGRRSRPRQMWRSSSSTRCTPACRRLPPSEGSPSPRRRRRPRPSFVYAHVWQQAVSGHFERRQRDEPGANTVGRRRMGSGNYRRLFARIPVRSASSARSSRKGHLTSSPVASAPDNVQVITRFNLADFARRRQRPAIERAAGFLTMRY